jgi:orotate phosphoribosyltransferase
MQHEIESLLPARKGHFLLESGHHGEFWLDLELLCLHPEAVQKFAVELALKIEPYHVEAVCGPLVEGAFIALMAATQLSLPFSYAERTARLPVEGLFPYAYQIPKALRPVLRNKRVAIVNDVISAGSSVRGTLADLKQLGAKPVLLSSLVCLGPSAARLAEDNGLAFETLLSQPYALWAPAECPNCARHEPLTDPTQIEETLR